MEQSIYCTSGYIQPGPTNFDADQRTHPHARHHRVKPIYRQFVDDRFVERLGGWQWKYTADYRRRSDVVQRPAYLRPRLFPKWQPGLGLEWERALSHHRWRSYLESE